MKCACGRDLHYSSPEARAAVERLIEGAGGTEYIVVTVTSQREGIAKRHFMVQRHYIALHGLKTQELLKGNIPGARELSGEEVLILLTPVGAQPQ